MFRFFRREAVRVAFRSDVSADFQTVAAEALVAGRYAIFGGLQEGTATLLLASTPRLVAVVRQEGRGRSKTFEILSLREADPDIDREREALGQL